MAYKRNAENQIYLHDRMIRYYIRKGGRACRPIRLRQKTVREMVENREMD